MNKLQLKHIFIFVLFALLLQACSGKQVTRETKPDPRVFAGKTTPAVACLKNTGVSYALYVPAAYDSSRSWPVIILFDSHGDGTLPVKLFREQAEKYGYILAGSNNSKNGQPTDVSTSFYDEMLKDLKYRFHLDQNRVYTCGFSGGSRVASSCALTRGGIRAVVGCSAGFPNVEGTPQTNFSYLGVAGNEDFNLMEMNRLMQMLEKTPIPHYLLVFDGKHAWPPASTIRDIFSWLEIKAMKDNLKPGNPELIRQVSDTIDSRFQLQEKKKNWLQMLYLAQTGMHFLDGYPSAAGFRKKFEELMKEDAVKKAMAAEGKLDEKEVEMQKMYGEAIQTKDLAWWEKEVARMKALSKNAPVMEERLIYKRTLSYLSLMAYMTANSAMKAGQDAAFLQFVRIYALVDPENSEHAYMLAILMAKQGKDSETIKSLAEAVDLGFNDVNRLKTDTSFSRFHDRKEFEEIVTKAGNTK